MYIKNIVISLKSSIYFLLLLVIAFFIFLMLSSSALMKHMNHDVNRICWHKTMPSSVNWISLTQENDTDREKEQVNAETVWHYLFLRLKLRILLWALVCVSVHEIRTCRLAHIAAQAQQTRSIWNFCISFLWPRKWITVVVIRRKKEYSHTRTHKQTAKVKRGTCLFSKCIKRSSLYSISCLLFRFPNNVCCFSFFFLHRKLIFVIRSFANNKSFHFMGFTNRII